MVQQKIYNLIRYNFARFLQSYKETNIISEYYIRNCANEIIKLIGQNPKIIKYELTNDKKGLYVKQNKNFYNPCYIVAGGASLKGFNFNLLENKTTIISNKYMQIKI